MRCFLCGAVLVVATKLVFGQTLPTDNPVATFYSGDAGYPAWTDQVPWSNVIDMKAFSQGKTDFERFERARDRLAAQGGGVLYYPAGTYDFSDGPFDGLNGRGLMLRGGVVIRGEAPAGKPLATSGKLDLPTKFVFGFKHRKNAINAGDRGAMRPETPRDWNLIGLMPPPGKRIGDVQNVGLALVHLVGAVIYFGPDIEWGKGVRYAWKNDPIVNLFGKNGLPVGPFRTDSFDLINADSEK